MNASLVLRTTLEQVTPALRAAAAQLWREPGLNRRYVAYLSAMHGVLRASVPLMELAARHAEWHAEQNVESGALGRYLRRHIVEERGHDEWVLADLAAAGVTPDVTVAPPPVVARLVGPQYYWILHHDPVALLGYIAVLEGNAPAPELAGLIVARTGLPPGAVRTVREHAALDVAHADEVLALLDLLPLTAAQLHTVVLSALSTVDALIDLYRYLSETEDDHDRAELHAR
jgi:hypothetical protein